MLWRKVRACLSNWASMDKHAAARQAFAAPWFGCWATWLLLLWICTMSELCHNPGCPPWVCLTGTCAFSWSVYSLYLLCHHSLSLAAHRVFHPVCFGTLFYLISSFSNPSISSSIFPDATLSVFIIDSLCCLLHLHFLPHYLRLICRVLAVFIPIHMFLILPLFSLIQFLTKHMCFFSLVTPYNSLVIPVDIVYKRTSKRALVRVEPRYVTVWKHVSKVGVTT